MSTAPPLHLLIAAATDKDPKNAAQILARVSAALPPPGGFDAILRRAVALPDSFVALVAEHGGDGQRVALAKNLCLTPLQLTVLIEAGGRPVVRAVFSPPAAETRTRSWGTSSDDDADEAGAKPGAEAVRAAEEAPDTVDPDTAVAVLQDHDCPPERALGLLRAQPLLAHTARVPTVDPALAWSSNQGQRLSAVPRQLDQPWESVTALSAEASLALGRGAMTPEDLCGRVRPALVAVQTMARLVRSRAPRFPDKASADAVVRPLLARTVGADPRAWALLAARLATATTPLTVLLADIAEEVAKSAAVGQVPGIDPPAKARPALLFLVRRLSADDIRALLPHFDERTTEDLIQGDAPIPAELLELAYDTGNRVLLGKVASHQHLRDEQAQRIRACDDIDLDRRLVWNRAGLTAALRGEILAGFRPGGRPRREVDELLRQWIVESPDHLEPKTVVRCGDPVLVCLALGRRPRLRRIDLVDVVLSLWDRGGPEAVAAVVTSAPEAFPAPVRKVVDAALAAGATQELDAARERWDRGTGKAKKEPADSGEVPEWSVEPSRRLREYELPTGGDMTWIRSSVPGDVVTWGRPAVRALDALPLLCADGRSGEVRAALGARVGGGLGSDPEAWAVFVQLLPEFAGTLPELAELSAAAAYRPEGAV
ncbi:MAG TPA: hypothetical protein VLH10_25585 [Yinghuangia sp.]|nr:hypothetical protein [Yinghuangia sp.]